MANALYAKGKEALLKDLDLTTAAIKAILVKNTYPQNLAVDAFLSDISAYQVGAAVALAGKTVAGGVFDATDINFAAVASGNTCEAVVLFEDTGTATTSRLLAYIDTITNFPVTTSGGDIGVQWDNGANKILAL